MSDKIVASSIYSLEPTPIFLNIGGRRVDDDGQWSASSMQDIPVGEHTVTVSVSDQVGQRVFTTYTVVVDTTAPNALTIQLDPASDTGVSSSDRVTGVVQCSMAPPNPAAWSVCRAT